MNVSYRWLKELAPTIPGSAQEAADRITNLGAAVDDVVPLGRGLEGVVIGRVERVRRHPNADRLVLCDVRVGNGTVQVVTGALKVVEGGYYAFIGAGGTLPGGVKIERAKLRGVVSDGMLCSERELGLGRDAEGIMQLHGEFAVGAPIVEALGLDDHRLVLDVTANRGDLLGHWGVGRELARGGVRDLRLPPFPGHAGTGLDFAQGAQGAQGAESAAAGVPIRIEDADGCARYVGVVIRGVTVGPSPEWLATRLRAVGARPINNVVDATNYVLFELNQPIHAFDLATLHGPAIVVRRARVGERVRTLDEVDRKLDPEILVIADADRAIAVAGVMGGAETEVGEGTRDLLVEVAWFEPRRVRTGSRILGLDTDASHRFQRGMDPEAIPAAAHRVVELILTVAGGRVEGPAADAYPRPWTPPVVALRPKRVSHLLGVEVPEKEVRAHLEPLGLIVEGSGATLKVRVPSWRPDLTREVDLIEEVARRRGYDSFPDCLRPFRPGLTHDAPVPRAVDRIRRAMVRLGFLEARTVAFVPGAEGAVPIRNPLSEEEGHLRRSLLPGLVHRVEHNFARRTRDLRLFEVATVFLPSGGERPDEELHLAAAWTGTRTPPHWSEQPADFDLWDLKAFLEEMAPLAAGPAAGVRPLDPQAADAWGALPFEPEAFAVVTPEGEAVGGGGRLRRNAVDAPPWAGAVWGLEIAVLHLEPPVRRYAPVPVFPAVERDLAIVVRHETPAAAVEDEIRHAAPDTLEAVDLFDVYAGEKIAAGHRSLAFRLRFRAADRTLTDGEVDEAVNRVIRHLKEALNVSIRGE